METLEEYTAGATLTAASLNNIVSNIKELEQMSDDRTNSLEGIKELLQGYIQEADNG